VAIYYVYSGAVGSNNGSSWANAFTTLTTAFVTEAAGDTLYVAHDHAESTAGAVTLTSSGTIANPTKVICVNRAGTVPPVSADRRATATVSATSGNITITGPATHYDGIIFNTSSSFILHTVNNNWLRFDNCSLRLTTGGTFLIGGATGALGGCYTELNNTTFSFAGVNDTITFAGTIKYRNTASALLGAAVPTNLFFPTGTRGGLLECNGVDFSAAGSGKTIVRADGTTQSVVCNFLDCKLNASVTKATAGMVGHGSTEVDFVRSGSAGVNYAIHRQRISGTLTEETTIVRTGGATDQVTPISWKVVTTATCTYSLPFECPPIAIWNDITGSAVTATVECIAAAIMTDAECWLEVEYLGDASSPMGSFVNDGKADLIATAANQTTSTETWGGSTAKFKLAVTFTAQQKGWIYGRVKIGKASSTTYIDPLITLT